MPASATFSELMINSKSSLAGRLRVIAGACRFTTTASLTLCLLAVGQMPALDRQTTPDLDLGMKFPKINPEKSFAELKVYDKNGHPWRQPMENWDNAKILISKDKGWISWYKTEREKTDQWMSGYKDRLEWVAGWWHDFVSPFDGTPLEWKAEMPGENNVVLRDKSGREIEVTEKLTAAWIYKFRTMNFEMIQNAARLYKLTNEKKYAEWACRQIDFYADSYLKWPLSSRKDGARMFWATLDEGVALAKVADSIRLMGEFISSDRRESWRKTYFNPISKTLLHGENCFYSEWVYKYPNNMALWQCSAVAQIALASNDKELLKEAMDGPGGFRNQIEGGITSDYLENTQSPGYNNYYARAALGTFMMAGLLGRSNELDREMCIIQNILLSPIFIRWPDDKIPALSDTMGRFSAFEKFELFKRIYPNMSKFGSENDQYTWDELLDPQLEISESKTPLVLPKVSSWLMESSRIAVLRKGDWQVLVQFGQLTRFHAQEEALQFMAYNGATDITSDPGTVQYGSKLHKGYFQRGLNHNVPLINGEGMSPILQYGNLVSFRSDQIEVSLPEFRPDASANRKISIVNNSMVDELSVSLKGDQPKNIGMMLHLQGHVKLNNNFTPDDAFMSPPRTAPFKYLKDPSLADCVDSASWTVEYPNDKSMTVTIAVPGKFKVWHAFSPDTSPSAQRECFYVEKNGTAASFTTTIK